MSRKATATIRTDHDDPEVVAQALRPDNTDEMETVVDREAGAVVTRIERETTSGLHSTVDDYVVNLEVATEIVDRSTGGSTAQPTDGHGSVSDPDPDSTHHNNE